MYVRIYFINSFLVSIWYPSYFRNTYLNMYYIYIFKSLRYINIFITPNPQVLSCIQPAISQFESKKLSPKLAIHLVPQNKLRNGWVVQKHVLSLKNIENIFILGKISITIPKPENCCWELKLKPQTLEITPHPTNLSSLKKKTSPLFGDRDSKTLQGKTVKSTNTSCEKNVFQPNQQKNSSLGFLKTLLHASPWLCLH